MVFANLALANTHARLMLAKLHTGNYCDLHPPQNKMPGIKMPDAVATGGLFGAVSGSTLAAVLPGLDAAKVPYEAWTAALYPFMDIPALVTAIVVASVYIGKKTGNTSEKVEIWPIIKESLQSSAVTAMLLGVALGILTKPEPVYESFFNPLFRGFLAVLMITLSLQTKLGEKVGILFDRVTELWDPSSSDPKKKKKGNVKVRYKYPTF